MIRRAANRWRRFAIEHFARHEIRLSSSVPYVSFTFDDFPRSALTIGGRILQGHGVRGTYFVSFQLLNANGVSGRVASMHDLTSLVDAGHELGCHTFHHVDGSVVSAGEFERSIEANRSALVASGLPAQFETFAYPLNGPAVSTKKVAAARFLACRGGGQTFNHDLVDLGLLKAFFLDARSRQMADIEAVIERNAAANGWLIFATHDVDKSPSDYGCESREFEAIVRRASASGARVLPVIEVYRELGLPELRTDGGSRDPQVH